MQKGPPSGPDRFMQPNGLHEPDIGGPFRPSSGSAAASGWPRPKRIFRSPLSAADDSDKRSMAADGLYSPARRRAAEFIHDAGFNPRQSGARGRRHRNVENA